MRPLTVQKFGGTSVGGIERIRRCVGRAIEARCRGDDVVVVVSAMGKTTDRLIELAGEVTSAPPRREMDQLMAAGEQVACALTAMALETAGQQAVSMTGAQIGLVTDAAHTKARIRSLDRKRIRGNLADGRVVVVAGFQGVTEAGVTTTLGRGGSDTTAVAVAAALDARVCEIYTDVEGVFTADPRLVHDARKLDSICYEEMLELAALGARVMAPRAVELAMRFGVPIHVRHSIFQEPGTMIRDEQDELETNQITGVALKAGLGRVTVADLPIEPGLQGALFAAVAEAGVLVEDIIQSETITESEAEGVITVSFTVGGDDLNTVRPVLDRFIAVLGRGSYRVDTGLCKVSAVGVGIRSHSGVAATMLRALARPGEGRPVRIRNIITSEIKISCIVAEDDGPRALRTVHEAFGLGA